MADNVMHISSMWVLDCHELADAINIKWSELDFTCSAENGSYQYLSCRSIDIDRLQNDIKYYEINGLGWCLECRCRRNTLAAINYIREHLAITDEVLINVYW